MGNIGLELSDAKLDEVLGNTINVKFDGNSFRGNFVGRPKDPKANLNPKEVLSNLTFHQDFPMVLKEKVLKRLKELKKAKGNQ